MTRPRPLPYAAIAVVAAVASALAARALPAQIVDEGRAVGGRGIVTLEGEISALSFDADGEREVLTGAGLRAMLHPFAGRPEDGPWWTRAHIGAFVSLTPERDGIETLHYGGQVDVHFVPAHRVARFDPFVSLGIGAFREPPFGRTTVPEEELDTVTELAVSPALGTHVVITPRFALRGDVRDVVVFRDGAVHNPQIAAGVVLVFSVPGWADGAAGGG